MSAPVVSPTPRSVGEARETATEALRAACRLVDHVEAWPPDWTQARAAARRLAEAAEAAAATLADGPE